MVIDDIAYENIELFVRHDKEQAMTGTKFLAGGSLGVDCILDFFFSTDSATDITKDAESLVNSLVDFYQYQIDTA